MGAAGLRACHLASSAATRCGGVARTSAIAYGAAGLLVALTGPRVTFLIAGTGMLAGLANIGPAPTGKRSTLHNVHYRRGGRGVALVAHWRLLLALMGHQR